MATRQDIQSIIIYMQGLFPNYRPDVEPITPEHPFNTTEAMLDVLGDLSTDDLRMAVRVACMPGIGRQFAPSADEIRSALIGLRAKVSCIPAAAEAWGEIMGSFERMPAGNMAGGGHTPILDHPLVKKAVYCMGGYASIGVDFYENMMANRAHFLRIYNELLEHWQDETAELPALTEYVQQQKQIGDGVRMLTDRMAQ